MMNLLEIAVYAVILSGNAPLTCSGTDHVHVACTNGLSAEVTSWTAIRFSNGVIVDQNNSFPLFSNGIHSWLNSEGWVAFSTGVQARHMEEDYFKLSNGLECRTPVPTIVECKRPDHPSQS